MPVLAYTLTLESSRVHTGVGMRCLLYWGLCLIAKESKQGVTILSYMSSYYFFMLVPYLVLFFVLHSLQLISHMHCIKFQIDLESLGIELGTS